MRLNHPPYWLGLRHLLDQVGGAVEVGGPLLLLVVLRKMLAVQVRVLPQPRC
jgi:hypothetical protein